MKDFVLDASVPLGWLIDHSPSPYAGRIQQLIEGDRWCRSIGILKLLMRCSPHNGENSCAGTYLKFWQTSML